MKQEQTEEWGLVRVRKTLIESIAGFVANHPEYNSISDFISQNAMMGLKKVSKN